jgi:AcrR family transcriptional regulator
LGLKNERGTVKSMTEPGEIGRRERKKQATRQHIAMTAVRLFLERGFDDVSVAEIADAADVSKVTVFNYFPSKADMVFELAESADPAGAVRARAPGESPLDAVRHYYFGALERRAEWTCLHDGVDRFARVLWASPTLLSAAAWRQRQAELALAVELARAVGETPWEIDPFTDTDHSRPPEAIGHRLGASMISGAIDALISANAARMLAGQSADDAAPAAIAEAELAFELLSTGVGRYGAG